MEEAELLAFQRASELYTKACREERSHFKRLLEGYKKGEKQSVVERLDYVLDKVSFPTQSLTSGKLILMRSSKSQW